MIVGLTRVQAAEGYRQLSEADKKMYKKVTEECKRLFTRDMSEEEFFDMI